MTYQEMKDIHNAKVQHNTASQAKDFSPPAPPVAAPASRSTTSKPPKPPLGSSRNSTTLLDLLALEPGGGSMQSMYLKEAKEAAASVHEATLSPAHKQLATLLTRPQVGPAVEITVGVRDANRMYSYTKLPLHIGAFDWGHYITYTIGDGDDQQFFGGPATRENITTALDTLRSTLPC